MYNVQLINKSFQNIPVKLNIKGLQNAQLNVIGNSISELKAESLAEAVFIVEVPEKDVIKRNNTLFLEIYSNGELIQNKKVSFLGPIK